MPLDELSIVRGPFAAAYEKYGSKVAAGRALGMPESTFRYNLKKEQSGVNVSEKIIGTSTLYDANGNEKLQWVKTKEDKDALKAALSLYVQGLLEEIVPLTPKPKPEITEQDLLSCYIISDYHLGQLSWGEETGDDWDADLAFNKLPEYVQELMDRAPASEVGLLAQLGDFLHWDGFEAVTPSSGHLLDADTRFHRLAFMAGQAIRTVIDMMLDKHERVHVIMAEGNHDMASSVWLTVLIDMIYSDESRVTIDTNPAPYYCFEWGGTSLFFHHGHKKRLADISKTFAAMFRETFGRTERSYAHMGHLHHKHTKEDSLMVVEQHPTLAARDAYAARGGWLSDRGASVITYSKSRGEEERSTIRP